MKKMMGGITLRRKYPSWRAAVEVRKLVPCEANPRSDLAR